MTDRNREFDFEQQPARLRHALRTDRALAEVGVAAVQRAVIRLLLLHQRAQTVDEQQKIVRLRITYREAGEWIRHNVPDCRRLKVPPSVVRRAVGRWCWLGVMGVYGSPTWIACHFGRLADWHAYHEALMAEALLGPAPLECPAPLEFF